MKNTDKLLFLLALSAVASAVAVRPAHALVDGAATAPATSARQNQIAGIGETPITWRMSVEQIKAVAPDKTLLKLGVVEGHEFYQLESIEMPAMGDPAIWNGILEFDAGQLVGFELRPADEQVTSKVIGHFNVWSYFLSLAVMRPKLFPEIAEPKLRAIREVQGANGSGAELGFQIQYRSWSTRGAHYRESIWFGGYRSNVGVARFQGRLSAPFGELRLDDNGANRAAFVRRVSRDFGVPGSLEKALLADNTLFQAPKANYQGDLIGFETMRWNMTERDVATATLPPGAQLQKLDGKRFIVRNFKLRRDSQLPWLLELRLDKKGLSEFELRPEKELQTAERIGLFDANGADDYQDALDEFLEGTRRIEPAQWWVASSNVDTRVKKTYRAQSGTGVGIGSTGFGYYAYTYPTYSTYKQFQTWPVTLPFTIRERGWSVGDNHFRQAQLLNAKTGPKINVIRYQGRRDNKPFRAGTDEIVKTKNPKVVMREVYENYNVKPQ